MSCDLLCLGELLVDMFPAEVGRSLADVSAFLPKPGGAPANVAVAARRLGLSTAFVGKVGEDAFGRHLAEVLDQEGVDTHGLCFDPDARTTLAFIAMPDPNHPEYAFYRNPGADLQLAPADLAPAQFSALHAFHFGSVSLSGEPARSATLEGIRLAHLAGALVSFDVNFRPALWADADKALAVINQVIPQADLLKVNEVELELLAGSEELEPAAKSLLERGPALVVVTLGATGSFFCAADGCGFVPAFQDWRQHLDGDTLHSVLRYANAVGALTATRLGVIPALPTAAEVDQFLQSRL